MEFTLLYRGPIPPNGGPEDKHRIRMQIHPQLAELWRQQPLRRFRTLLYEESATLPEDEGQLGGEHVLRWWGACVSVRRRGHVFAPLVSKEIHLVAHLQVLLLRPGEPGQVIRHGGDLDNRLKTLLDALTVPDENQIERIRDVGVDPGERFIYCLLQDDALVSSIFAETDRLLAPTLGGPEVAAVIRVRLGRTKGTPIAVDLT